MFESCFNLISRNMFTHKFHSIRLFELFGSWVMKYGDTIMFWRNVAPKVPRNKITVTKQIF